MTASMKPDEDLGVTIVCITAHPAVEAHPRCRRQLGARRVHGRRAGRSESSPRHSLTDVVRTPCHTRARLSLGAHPGCPLLRRGPSGGSFQCAGTRCRVADPTFPDRHVDKDCRRPPGMTMLGVSPDGLWATSAPDVPDQGRRKPRTHAPRATSVQPMSAPTTLSTVITIRTRRSATIADRYSSQFGCSPAASR
jgi:hypothetical protein